jgi:hypothetical protein
MINRARVQELASQSAPRPESDPRGAAVQETWQQAYVRLIRIFASSSSAEFDRREGDFPRAFRAFRSYLVSHKQEPDRHDGRPLNDPEFEHALIHVLHAAVESMKTEDPARVSQRWKRRAAMGRKIVQLLTKCGFVSK